jgi:hypothetical protein
MSTDRDQCLERAKFCVKLAESEEDPFLRAFLERLASQWKLVANDTPPKADKAGSDKGGSEAPRSKASSTLPN